MHRPTVALAACVAGALTVGACRDDGPAAVDLGAATTTGWRVRLASAPPARVDPFRELDAPITLEVVDGGGRPVRGVSVQFRVATGLVNLGDRSDSASAWVPARALGTFVRAFTDARGRLAIRWMPGGEPTQRLVVATFAAVRDTVVVDSTALVIERPLARAAVPLEATQVAPAGAHVTCVLVGTRVGCTGHRRFLLPAPEPGRTSRPRWDRSDVPTLALGEPRWLDLPGTPVRLVSMRGAACAVLRENGRLACWRDLGPAGPVSIADRLPPLRVVDRDMGIDSSGTAGFITHDPGGGVQSPTEPDSTQPVMRWVALPSDVPMVRFATNWNGNFFCGFTASDAVRCAWRVSWRTDPNDSRFLPVRAPDGTEVRARRMTVARIWDAFRNSAELAQLTLVAADGARTSAWFRIALSPNPMPAWLPISDVRLVPPDAWSPLPGEGTPPLSMGWYGEFVPSRGGYSSGAERRCESAGVVVCTWRLGMNDTFFLTSSDTVRVLGR